MDSLGLVAQVRRFCDAKEKRWSGRERAWKERRRRILCSRERRRDWYERREMMRRRN